MPAAAERPLGEAPLLLARIQTGHDRNGQPVVALHPAQGQGMTLTFDSVLLHSVCRLLQSAVKKSDWDMELKLPGHRAAGGRRARPHAQLTYNARLFRQLLNNSD